jgi:Kef-type K+ transport system membrane component KefB
MGRIPGFTKNIFPPASIPSLTLVANIGLVIFLFLVGLEADLSVFKKNGKAALGISFVGLAVPFGLGAAVSVGIYRNFVSDDVDFGIFLLFIGTAMA